MAARSDQERRALLEMTMANPIEAGYLPPIDGSMQRRRDADRPMVAPGDTGHPGYVVRPAERIALHGAPRRSSLPVPGAPLHPEEIRKLRRMSLQEASTLPSFAHINATSEGKTGLSSEQVKRRLEWQKSTSKLKRTTETEFMEGREHPKFMPLMEARDFVKGYVFGQGEAPITREELRDRFGLVGMRQPTFEVEHESLMLRQQGPRRASVEGLPLGYKPCS